MKTHGALGALAGGMAVIALVVAFREPPKPPPAAKVASLPIAPQATLPSSPSTTSDDEALARLRVARTAGDDRALSVALASDDPIVVLEAIDGMVEAGCTACIADLVRIDLHGDGRVGATAIGALGVLGAKASPRERTMAVEGLVRLLGLERKSAAPEADANVLGIIESLGAIGDPRGVRELEALLEDRSLDLVTQLLVIRSIGTPSTSGRARLVAIREERSIEAAGDDFERELRRELDDAIRTTLGG